MLVTDSFRVENFFLSHVLFLGKVNIGKSFLRKKNVKLLKCKQAAWSETHGSHTLWRIKPTSDKMHCLRIEIT